MAQCSVCGKEISDDLTIHVSRYHPLWADASTPAIEAPLPRPWLAALLNIIPLGVGYYYLRPGR